MRRPGAPSTRHRDELFPTPGVAGLNPVPRYRFIVGGDGADEEEHTMSFEIPDACTLPTAERPLRLAEFERLFAGAARSVERLDPRHVRMHLTGPVGLEATVRDLAARENACCGFFGFTVTAVGSPDGETVTLDVEVPAARVDVLNGLAGLAETASAGRPDAVL
jgi:hypothetical protein